MSEESHFTVLFCLDAAKRRLLVCTFGKLMAVFYV